MSSSVAMAVRIVSNTVGSRGLEGANAIEVDGGARRGAGRGEVSNDVGQLKETHVDVPW
jgi:hypothetical protein